MDCPYCPNQYSNLIDHIRYAHPDIFPQWKKWYDYYQLKKQEKSEDLPVYNPPVWQLLGFASGEQYVEAMSKQDPNSRCKICGQTMKRSRMRGHLLDHIQSYEKEMSIQHE